jgi:hypothetical protein
MFGSNTVLPRGGITSYEQAVAKHDSIVPIRGRSTDTRPLGQRRNDNFTIRKLDNGSVAIRLYQTDIITYHDDGTIDLEPYASKLTDEAVNQVLRGAVWASYTNPVGPVLWIRNSATNNTSMGYLVDGCATLGKDLNIIAGTKPFTRYSVNRKKANAACAKGFDQFKLWVQTQVRLGIDPRQGERWGTVSLSNMALACLDEPDRYADIARGMSTYVTVDSHLDAIRRQVLTYHDCIEETEVAYVTAYKQLTAIQSSKKRWG